jgi:DNA-binding FrmR family transcriptional regulator
MPKVAKPERGTPHHDELTRLRRIEGQVRGLQRMIEEDRYCIDILTQIRSVIGALERVSSSVLERHLHHCVAHALDAGSEAEKSARLEEVISVIRKARR